jgi:hypothetical protein
MRLVRGVGVEWGVEWVMRHLIEENLDRANVHEAFENSVRSCYEETVQVGWLTLDVADTIKEMDPISWDMARDEWVDAELSEGQLITLDSGSTYYSSDDLECYLDDSAADVATE